jgi:hypothetical protein
MLLGMLLNRLDCDPRSNVDKCLSNLPRGASKFAA